MGNDVLDMMAILKIAYPNYYKGMSRSDAESTVNLWTEMFTEDDSQVVAAAIKALIATDEKGFPPHIGAVKSYVRRITQEAEMTELEAWSLVKQAIKYSSQGLESRVYRDGMLSEFTSAERNFRSLPETIQNTIGSPDRLADWALLPEYEAETVIALNFMRSYKAKAKAEKDYTALPADIKRMVNALSEMVGLLDGSAIRER